MTQNFFDFVIDGGVAWCNQCGCALTEVLTLDEINQINTVGLFHHTCQRSRSSSPLPPEPENFVKIQPEYVYGVDNQGHVYREYTNNEGEQREYAKFICDNCHKTFQTVPFNCERDNTIFCCEECMNEASPEYITGSDTNGDYQEYRDGVRDYVSYYCDSCGGEFICLKIDENGRKICMSCYDE
jgi:hypothetical protein